MMEGFQTCAKCGVDHFIEPGKRADLLVVDGDPLADIALLQHPDKLMAIVKEGQFHKRQI